MLIALVVVGGLITLGGITVLSVQSGLTAVSHDRHRSAALYAAESGASVAMIFLRANISATTRWSAYVEPNNTNPQQPAEIAGNGAQPGDADNIFSDDMVAWYEVTVLNNRDDVGFSAGDDLDGVVIIRSTGHGPNGSTAQVEWEVRSNVGPQPGRPCPSYGQKGVAEDGAGRNDCLGVVNVNDTATYVPGT